MPRALSANLLTMPIGFFLTSTAFVTGYLPGIAVVWWLAKRISDTYTKPPFASIGRMRGMTTLLFGIALPFFVSILGLGAAYLLAITESEGAASVVMILAGWVVHKPPTSMVLLSLGVCSAWYMMSSISAVRMELNLLTKLRACSPQMLKRTQHALTAVFAAQWIVAVYIWR